MATSYAVSMGVSIYVQLTALQLCKHCIMWFGVDDIHVGGIRRGAT